MSLGSRTVQIKCQEGSDIALSTSQNGDRATRLNTFIAFHVHFKPSTALRRIPASNGRHGDNGGGDRQNAAHDRGRDV